MRSDAGAVGVGGKGHMLHEAALRECVLRSDAGAVGVGARGICCMRRRCGSMNCALTRVLSAWAVRGICCMRRCESVLCAL